MAALSYDGFDSSSRQARGRDAEARWYFATRGSYIAGAVEVISEEGGAPGRVIATFQSYPKNFGVGVLTFASGGSFERSDILSLDAQSLKHAAAEGPGAWPLELRQAISGPPLGRLSGVWRAEGSQEPVAWWWQIGPIGRLTHVVVSPTGQATPELSLLLSLGRFMDRVEQWELTTPSNS